MLLKNVLNHLQVIAPLEFAESWDNVGLLIGKRDRSIACALTCLTLTQTTLDEAIQANVDLIICHHPIPFKPLAKLTDDTSTGRLLLQAIEAKIAIYSPHTAWDNAPSGINQQLADILQLERTESLQPFRQIATLHSSEHPNSMGVGRCGDLTRPANLTIGGVWNQLKESLPSIEWRSTRSSNHAISRIGIVCGSGGTMIDLVASRGCDAMLTGEATYHQCLEAESRGIAMLLMGHHASEFFAIKTLAIALQLRMPEIRVFASQREESNF